MRYSTIHRRDYLCLESLISRTMGRCTSSMVSSPSGYNILGRLGVSVCLQVVFLWRAEMETRWMDVFTSKVRNRIQRRQRESSHWRRECKKNNDGEIIIRDDIDVMFLCVCSLQAITCYYSYIINGLLEGEEKVIVMNRRIYKLFPDG